MLELALGGEGYEVDAVADGESALDRLERHRYGLVLTDLKLPGISGLEVVAAVRERQPEASVVVLTAYGTVGTAVEAMKRGASDFLEKPVELDDLFRLVAGVLAPAADPRRTSRGWRSRARRRIVGRHPRLQAALRAAAPGGADRDDGAADRRERHRQGAVRAHAPRAVGARGAGRS